MKREGKLAMTTPGCRCSAEGKLIAPKVAGRERGILRRYGSATQFWRIKYLKYEVKSWPHRKCFKTSRHLHESRNYAGEANLKPHQEADPLEGQAGSQGESDLSYRTFLHNQGRVEMSLGQ